MNVRVTRGASGKWVADVNGLRIGSGHVPIRAGEWEKIVVHQLTRQAQGQGDPGTRLGGGHIHFIDVPDQVTELLVQRKHAQMDDAEQRKNQEWQVTFVPLREGLAEIEPIIVRAATEYDAKWDGEHRRNVNMPKIHHRPVKDYRLAIERLT